MVYSIVRFFYPSIKDEEIKKFCLLALIFLFLIGGYWLMRLLKDTIFFKIAFPEGLGWAPQQGKNFQPIAKIISPFVVVGCILIYSKLVDIYKRHHLFYILCTFYAILYATVTAMLFARANYGDAALGKTLLGTLGWVSYFGIESFGSLMPALFWS
ncbi:MAG: Npt1/Npt2 family nucleotide transporter, partial [Waddliaceae bacterium]